jgi:hypothetical protein
MTWSLITILQPLILVNDEFAVYVLCCIVYPCVTVEESHCAQSFEANVGWPFLAGIAI